MSSTGPRAPAAARPLRSKRIKDPVHDFIVVEPFARALVDHPVFQRLRNIRQTGTAHLVYPGANHTRFEHSLGAHHLATVASGGLQLDEPTARLVAAAALLHDVGHGPFSHLSEGVIEEHTGKRHEQHTLERIEAHLADALEAHDIPLKELGSLLLGSHPLKRIISGPLDVDRTDYLLRDGHYTGVATSVDAHRLMATVRLRDNEVVYERDALNVAEQLLVTRFAMHAAVYYHHTCRAAELLLEDAMGELVEEGEITGQQLAEMDDPELLVTLRRHDGEAGQMARRVFERRLPKVAFQVPYKALEDRWVEANSGNRKRLHQLEHEIADKAGVPGRHVQVDLPLPPTLPEVDAPMLHEDGRVEPLTEASTLVRALAQAHRDHWHFRVYAPEGSRDAVARAAPRVIALERPLDEF